MSAPGFDAFDEWARQNGEPVTNELGEVVDVLPVEPVRMATCPNCKTAVPSDPGLPFFEDRGPGSASATEHCVCGFYEGPHLPWNPLTKRPGEKRDHAFTPRGPSETDRYYCGCRGWD